MYILVTREWSLHFCKLVRLGGNSDYQSLEVDTVGFDRSCLLLCSYSFLRCVISVIVVICHHLEFF